MLWILQVILKLGQFLFLCTIKYYHIILLEGGLIMNMQKKTIVFFSTCIIFVCFIVAFLGYRNAVNGFEESLTDQAKDAGSLFNSLVENAYAGQWNVKNGELYKGAYLINGKTTIIDELSRETGNSYTVFLKDTRITTTVKNETGERAIGTKASPDIVHRVLEKNETVITQAQVLGTLHFVCYDYPNFHLNMRCFMCSLVSEDVTLLEHEAMKWLTAETIFQDKLY